MARWKPRPRRAKRCFSLGGLRLAVLVGLFAASAWIWGDGGSWEPPVFLQTEPQRIEGSFTRCGLGRGYYCVVDGDTFKMGETSVRVVGIDTAEVDAACREEAEQAEASTAALQRWLNRGPFRISARIDEPTDKYGRALRIVKRINPDGSEDRLADYMRAEGGARGYGGGGRGGWC
ncbi:MAG: thermonuclease family protein [Croceibacterium sp.]|jgi:micrococcal nuclease